MNEDFRNRAFIPVALPLGLAAGIAVFAWSLSRVFLALPALAATLVALAVAGYVLAVGSAVARQRELTGRSVAVGLVLGLVGVLGAGAVASAVGPREFHTPGEEEAEEGEGGGEGEDGEEEEVEVPEDAVVFTAVDNDFTEAPDSVPAGTVTIALENEGDTAHTVYIENIDEQVVEAQGGQTSTGEVELEAGETYSYICDVPGHEQTMNGEFTVEG